MVNSLRSDDEAITGQAAERETELQEIRKEVERASVDLNRLMEQKDLETKEEYEARQTKMAELDPQRKRYIGEIKARREDWVKTVKDEKSRLLAEIERTDRNLSNNRHNYRIAQARREEAKARLVRLGKEERELVRPQAAP